MLRVTIEVVPFGIHPPTTLAIYEIVNIGQPVNPEFEDSRSYTVQELHRDGKKETRAVVVHRRSNGFLPLAVRALHFVLRRRQR